MGSHGIEHIKKKKVELKEELNSKGIKSDRDLHKLLNLSPENKSLLSLWMNYQATFNKINYYEHGQEDLKEDLNDLKAQKKALLKPNRTW